MVTSDSPFQSRGNPQDKYPGKKDPIRILFICTYNKMRSKTAEALYSGDARFEVLSAGTSDSAVLQVSEALLEWSDNVVVMEEMHREWIRKTFPEPAGRRGIFCLNIPDEYWFMDPELVILIRERFEILWRSELA
jgi:predicted protein tyrosine phosphatase